MRAAFQSGNPDSRRRPLHDAECPRRVANLENMKQRLVNTKLSKGGPEADLILFRSNFKRKLRADESILRDVSSKVELVTAANRDSSTWKCFALHDVITLPMRFRSQRPWITEASAGASHHI